MVLRKSAATVQEVFLKEERLGFRRGLMSLLRAIRFLLSRPKYLMLCVAPWAINIFVLGPILFFVMKDAVYPWAIGFVPEEGFWWQLVRITTGIWLVAILGGLSLLGLLLGAVIFGAPFHDKVGELVEKERLAHRPDLLAPDIPFWRGVRYSLFEALKRVVVGLPVLVIALTISCIPYVGPPIAFLIEGITAAVFLTLDAFSMPMDRRSIPLGGKLAFIRNNIRFAVGFGLPMLVIPCAIFLMPPIAAVAASLIYTDVLLSGEKKRIEGE